MLNCYLCTKECTSIKQYIWHLKVFHYNLGPESLYTCKQHNCFRDFLGISKFKKHLINSHISDDLNTLLNFETNDSFENPNEFSCDSNVTLPSDDIINESNLLFEDNSEYEVHKDFKDIVNNNILSFISNLYSKPTVTGTLFTFFK